MPKTEIETLRAEVERLQEEAAKRKRLGRRALPPTSADAILVARVCEAKGVSRDALAGMVGVHRTMLCGPGRTLPARVRLAVQALDEATH